jgi:adenylate kinase
MNLIFIGPQGSGKGTQAKLISEKFGFAHISTGDLLRGLNGKPKEETDSYMLSGKLVPDEFIIKILKDRIAKEDCKKGVILDGFPRNLNQAKELDKIIKIRAAFNIDISDDEAIKRISGRFLCSGCGAGYNIYTEPRPREEGICDKCGGKLIQRKDDNKEAVKTRLKTYHEETIPLLKNYNTIKINGNQAIDKVKNDIEKAIGFLRLMG